MIGIRTICRACALAALALAAAGAVLAQNGVQPKSPYSGSGAPSNAGSELSTAPPRGVASRQAREAIGRDQDAAQARLDAIEASPGATLGAPPDTPAIEIAERLTLARQLVGVYQQQRDVIDRTDAARAARIEAELATQSWRGFATPPPYSVLTIDALRDSEYNASTRIASAEARRAMFDRFEVEFGSKIKASQGAARLAAEAADRARGAPELAALEWRRNLAALRAELDQATERLLQLGLRNAREDIASGVASRDLARRQLAAAGSDIAFLPGDVERIHAELDARRRDADAAMEKAVRKAAEAQAARTQAEDALAAARAAPVVPDAAAARASRVDELAKDALQKREEAATATLRVDLLKGFRLAIDGERAVWAARAAALQSRDPLQSRAGYEQLTGRLTTIRAWREYLSQHLVAVRDQVADQETKLRLAHGADVANAQLLAETYRQRQSDMTLALERSQPLERLLSQFRTDFEGRREISMTDRARDAGAAALLLAKRIWNLELLTVEDSLETAEGRTIKVERSVTIGKSAGAVLVVILGYWLCSVMARRIERGVVKRGRAAPQSAALLRSWILFVLAVILIIFALLSASIPLTAFAFLGGALAIAAGFGLQTLLKNFVAGIMLLFERPMRLGDLVEVDGFRGRVTSIGIRASTITSGDGIETMIPNSAFVENKLTNWTYSSPLTRHMIKIPVAYGTPLRQAADAMLKVLATHGLVLKEPPPQVYLEDYANSAINFAMTFWLDMTPGGDTRRVKSDILHMIDSAFATAGIRMPYPQRDVHLDSTTPPKVQVVAATKPKGDHP